jgi:hypothetical protein
MVSLYKDLRADITLSIAAILAELQGKVPIELNIFNLVIKSNIINVINDIDGSFVPIDKSDLDLIYERVNIFNIPEGYIFQFFIFDMVIISKIKK